MRTEHSSFEILLIKDRHGKQTVLPLLNTQSSAQEAGTSSAQNIKSSELAYYCTTN